MMDMYYYREEAKVEMNFKILRWMDLKFTEWQPKDRKKKRNAEKI